MQGADSGEVPIGGRSESVGRWSVNVHRIVPADSGRPRICEKVPEGSLVMLNGDTGPSDVVNQVAILPRENRFQDAAGS